MASFSVLPSRNGRFGAGIKPSIKYKSVMPSQEKIAEKAAEEEKVLREHIKETGLFPAPGEEPSPDSLMTDIEKRVAEATGKVYAPDAPGVETGSLQTFTPPYSTAKAVKRTSVPEYEKTEYAKFIEKLTAAGVSPKTAYKKWYEMKEKEALARAGISSAAVQKVAQVVPEEPEESEGTEVERVTTASMFGGKLVPLMISSAVLYVAYKLFFEKKYGRR